MVLVPHEIISNSLVTLDLTRDTAFAGNMVTPNQNLYFLIKKDIQKYSRHGLPIK